MNFSSITGCNAVAHTLRKPRLSKWHHDFEVITNERTYYLFAKSEPSKRVWLNGFSAFIGDPVQSFANANPSSVQPVQIIQEPLVQNSTLVPIGGQTIMANNIPLTQTVVPITNIPYIPINMNVQGINQNSNVLLTEAPIINQVKMSTPVSNYQNMPMNNNAFLTPLVITKMTPNAHGDFSPLMMSPLGEENKYMESSNPMSGFNNIPNRVLLAENVITESKPLVYINQAAAGLVSNAQPFDGGNYISEVKNSLNPIEKSGMLMPVHDELRTPNMVTRKVDIGLKENGSSSRFNDKYGPILRAPLNAINSTFQPPVAASPNMKQNFMTEFEKQIPAPTGSIHFPTADILNAPVSQAFKPLSHDAEELSVIASPVINMEHNQDSPVLQEILGSLSTTKILPNLQNATSISQKNLKQTLTDKENIPLRASSNIPKIGLDSLIEKNPLNNIKNENSPMKKKPYTPSKFVESPVRRRLPGAALTAMDSNSFAATLNISNEEEGPVHKPHLLPEISAKKHTMMDHNRIDGCDGPNENDISPIIVHKEEISVTREVNV